MLTSTRNIWLILLLVVACGISLRTLKALQMENYEHDDQISYLTAYARMGDYLQFADANATDPQLRTARDWQQFLTFKPEQNIANALLGTVQDLQLNDIHPPLYYLWLQTVLRYKDMTTLTGWLSNLPFFIANAGLLFLLALRLLKHRQQAWLATLIWAVSSAGIQTSIIARHYEILTLMTLASSLFLLSITRTEKVNVWQLLIYAALIACGFLANYQFAFHVAALSVFILVRYRHRPATVAVFALATSAALAAALSLYPAILHQSREVSDWVPEIGRQDVVFRIRNTAEELLKFCIPATLLLLFLLVKKRTMLTGPDRALWWLLGVNLLILAGTYLAFITPRHAMGGRYLAGISPFLSLLFAVVLSAYWQQRWFRCSALILIVVPGLLLLTKPVKQMRPPALLTSAPLVIADFDKRGVWPGLFMFMNPDQAVLVASRDSLLQNRDWFGALAQHPSAVYVSDGSARGNTSTRQEQILDTLPAAFIAEPVTTRDRGLRYVHVTRPPATDQ